jgi:hypothetical protein
MYRILIVSFFLEMGCKSNNILETKSIEKEAVTQAWTQVGPAGQMFARALVRGSTCPQMLADGQKIAMVSRGQPSTGFPGLVCEAKLPPHVGQVSVAHIAVPILKSEPKRILFLGDTGCRIRKEGSLMLIQN